MRQQQLHRLWISLAIVGVLLVAFWSRTIDLNQYPPGLTFDEAGNVMDAFHIAQSGVIPMYENLGGRQDSIYRPILAITMQLFGNTIWTGRITSVLLSLISIAAMYWLTTEVLHHQKKTTRQLCGLLAMTALTIFVSHTAVSRTVYRVNTLLPFVMLSLAFILRGLRTNQWRDFGFGGLLGGVALYTYPAAFFYPIGLVILGLSLFVLRLNSWRMWLPRMGLAALAAAIIAVPLAGILLTNPDAVLGRASDVDSGFSEAFSARTLQITWNALFVAGDTNAQYNVNRAPIILPMLQPLFWLGVLVLLWRIRHPASIVIFALLGLFTIPASASDQINHALRLYGEYAVLPVIIGASLVPILAWSPKRSQVRRIIQGGSILAIALLLFVGTNQNWQNYRNYWENASNFERRLMFEVVLNHNEWFFRQDRRDFAEWLTVQEFPILIPVDEVDKQTTRSWLLENYPTVITTTEQIPLPENTHLVMPYSLELSRLLDQEREYALLHEGVITLFPPLSAEAHTRLLANIDQGAEITREGDEIRFLGYFQALPNDFALEYTPPITASDNAALATFGADEIDITAWYGNDILSAGNQNFSFEWLPKTKIYHDYWTFVQIQTQDFERITGIDAPILRWIYPGTQWEIGDPVTDTFMLNVPEGLATGAYRLVVGMYPEGWPTIPATSYISETTNNAATVGWLKVPQAEAVTIPASARTIEATFDETFALTHTEFAQLENGQILAHLYWHSEINRTPIDATVFVHFTDAEGNIIVQNDSRPWDGQYPTFIWDQGEIVRTAHVLQLPENQSVENLFLRLGMYTFPGPQNLSVTFEDTRQPNDLLELGALQNWLNSGEASN